MGRVWDCQLLSSFQCDSNVVAQSHPEVICNFLQSLPACSADPGALQSIVFEGSAAHES